MSGNEPASVPRRITLRIMHLLSGIELSSGPCFSATAAVP
jgi:hypothetical protein